jgi:hypothetical protein
MHATQPTTPASPSNSLSGLDEYRPSETGEELSSRRLRSLYGLVAALPGR